uniref:Uncharacterized protein n=1 Tax=Octopus bimaculoides TaxID=37653 RepID=A0A0L8G8V1_OCTBM
MDTHWAILAIKISGCYFNSSSPVFIDLTMYTHTDIYYYLLISLFYINLLIILKLPVISSEHLNALPHQPHQTIWNKNLLFLHSLLFVLFA